MWPELSLEAALLWTARAAAWAAIVDTTELLVLRRNFGPGGIWEPELLAEDWRAFSRPMQVILHFFLARGFVPLLVLRLGLALALLGSGYLPLALPLLFGAVLTSLRFRGSYNGGSDSMMVVLWFGLGLASIWPDRYGGPAIGLGYIAVQAGLSYFVAGLVKAKVPGWWSGLELIRATQLPTYDVAAWARRLLGRPVVARVAALSMLALELLFPTALLGRPVALVFLLLLGVFHAINAVVFGLNRFFWTWPATYPAIYWAAGHLG
ncbi:MAG: HTTM domain-containing protein [Deltaproteobacteria bacterium]|jgi:hypothetical protein|nr:HTTM domain-containing protein [Deltaproteobacteria bacterium]